MSDTRTVAAENLDLIGSYSPDIHTRIYDFACRSDMTMTEKGIRKQMINLMVNMGFTTPMPGHGTSKPKKGKGLQPATKTYLANVAKALNDRGIA